MVDFAKLNERLQKELSSNTSNGDSFQSEERAKRRFPLLNVGKTASNHSIAGFVGRILPLADGWYAKEFERIWVEYNKASGEVGVAPIYINSEDSNDKLAQLAIKIMSYNASVDKEHKIKLNSHDSFGFRIERKAEMLGVPLVKVNTPQGVKITTKTNADGTLAIMNLTISQTAYRGIGESFTDEFLMVGGKPFTSPLKYVTEGETIPVSIKFSGEMSYNVVPNAGIVLPPVQYDYLEKLPDGTYKYFDDPETFNKLTKDESPDFYSFIYKKVYEKVANIIPNLDASFIPEPEETKKEQQTPLQENPYAKDSEVLPVSEDTQTIVQPKGTEVTVNQSEIQSVDVNDPFKDMGEFITIDDSDIPF